MYESLFIAVQIIIEKKIAKANKFKLTISTSFYNTSYTFLVPMILT